MDYLGALSGLDAPTRRARTQQLFERVGLAGDAEVRARCLDAGALRRLGVAQALIHDPRVLLLDEPTAGLAPEERARLRSLLSETAIDHLVVLATQRPDDVEAVCARVAVLEEGRLRYLGTAREMVARAEGKVFLADLPEEALPALRRRYRVVSVVSHGQRRVARFLDPEGAPGVGRADRPGVRDAYLLCLNGGALASVCFASNFSASAARPRTSPRWRRWCCLPVFNRSSRPPARIAATGEAAGEVEICVLPAEEYALSRDIDRFSGAHARLFASRVGGALAVLCPFPAAALFWHDRRACRAAIYARGISSLKLVLCRCAALTAAMLLPWPSWR